MTDLEVPPEFDSWPFDARKYVLAEANTGLELRREINSIVGLPGGDIWEDAPLSLTKDEAAAIVMALGGPREEIDG